MTPYRGERREGPGAGPGIAGERGTDGFRTRSGPRDALFRLLRFLCLPGQDLVELKDAYHTRRQGKQPEGKEGKGEPRALKAQGRVGGYDIAGRPEDNHHYSRREEDGDDRAPVFDRIKCRLTPGTGANGRMVRMRMPEVFDWRRRDNHGIVIVNDRRFFGV